VTQVDSGPLEKTLKDFRDHEISGATPTARDTFERALYAHLSWRRGAQSLVGEAIGQAPAFTMAHVLAAYLDLCSRDPRRVQLARAAHARAAALAATDRERLHVTAIGAALADDFETCSAILHRLQDLYPRDVLALQTGHSLDYLLGDVERMEARLAAALNAWSQDVPGYHSVLAMRAFSLVEQGDHARAIDSGLSALELQPADARAHHAIAHVHEMAGAASAGIRWMRARRAAWAEGSVAATHCWWHWALFHLTLGEVGAALDLYDRHVRAARTGDVADLIDATALLWRIELLGGCIGFRWQHLATDWAPHIEDGYCSFTDIHAMLAQVGAGEWPAARRLERHLLRHAPAPGRYGETTRLVGLPSCRAILAFGRGDYGRVLDLLVAKPAVVRRIGGSHAQRDLLELTREEALRRRRNAGSELLVRAARRQGSGATTMAPSPAV